MTCMTRDDYDVVIVGARCAGASLAAFLARAGASVLVVDKASLPSDHILSTHALHPAGLDVLEALGVADSMKQETPESRVFRLQRGRAHVDVTFPTGRGEYCPRRRFLDGLLQQAAREAGAELSDRTELRALITSETRVTGVRLRMADGDREVRARLVVGADGRDSTVARLTGSEEYLAYDAPRAMYWGYFPAPPDFGRCEEFPFGMYVGNRDEYVRVVFHTNENRVLLGCLPSRDDVARWKADPLLRLRAVLGEDPATQRLVAAAPDGKIRGLVSCRYFFRRATGRGWLLVGDAGVHKEFVTGDGMSEALIQARNAATAILEGTTAALRRFWRERDVLALPMYHFGQIQGALGPPTRLDEIVLEHAAEDPELQGRLVEILAHRRSPLDLVTPGQVIPWVVAAALRGQLGVLGDFLRQGQFVARATRETAERTALAARLA